MAKKIAVLVRERQEEGLRVAVGLTLADNVLEVFVLGRAVAGNLSIQSYLGTLRDLGASLATTGAAEAGLEVVSVAEVARRILRCDHILPY